MIRGNVNEKARIDEFSIVCVIQIRFADAGTGTSEDEITSLQQVVDGVRMPDADLWSRRKTSRVINVGDSDVCVSSLRCRNGCRVDAVPRRPLQQVAQSRFDPRGTKTRQAKPT